MHAVQYAGHGGTDVVTYGEVSDPEVGRDEVLVDAKAAALGHVDVWTRRGLPGLDLEMPHVPGSDAAGVVRAVGPDVSQVDDVLAKVWDGTVAVRVRERLPTSETGRAHGILEDREGFGKVVVRPDDECE